MIPNGQRLLHSRIWRCSTISEGAIFSSRAAILSNVFSFQSLIGIYSPLLDSAIFFNKSSRGNPSSVSPYENAAVKLVLSLPNVLPPAPASASTR